MLFNAAQVERLALEMEFPLVTGLAKQRYWPQDTVANLLYLTG